MVARINTVAFQGIEVRAVDVQVQISNGLPAFNIVGLPDKAVAESNIGLTQVQSVRHFTSDQTQQVKSHSKDVLSESAFRRTLLLQSRRDIPNPFGAKIPLLDLW